MFQPLNQPPPLVIPGLTRSNLKRGMDLNKYINRQISERNCSTCQGEGRLPGSLFSFAGSGCFPKAACRGRWDGGAFRSQGERMFDVEIIHIATYRRLNLEQIGRFGRLFEVQLPGHGTAVPL